MIGSRPIEGPRYPCRPNISTNTRPATTGDTEKGKSISVVSRFVPGKLKRRDSPGRGHPEDQIGEQRDADGEQREEDRMAAYPASLNRLSQ